MKWLLAIGLTVLVAVAIGCGASAGGGSGQCASELRWNGRIYAAGRPVAINALPPAGRSHSFKQGGCSDGGGLPGPITEVKLYERRGIPASILLTDGTGDQPNLLYVSDDSLPVLRDHPLHWIVFDSASEPDLVSGSCRPRAMWGIIRGVAGWDEQSIAFDEGSVRTRFEIDAGTQLRTRIVDGVPRIRPGDHVKIDAVVCSGSEIPIARIIQPA